MSLGEGTPYSLHCSFKLLCEFEMFQNKTLTLLAPAHGLPAWLSGGFLPYNIAHLRANDQHHWLLRPQEGGGPSLHLWAASRVHQVNQAPSPNPSAGPAYGFSSSSRRGQWCLTKAGEWMPFRNPAQWVGWGQSSLILPGRECLDTRPNGTKSYLAFPLSSPLLHSHFPGGNPSSHVRP